MELYHVSSKLYNIGQTISSEDFGDTTEYYQRKILENLNWIDDYLDTLRPGNVPPRRNSVFAFGHLKHCVAFCRKRDYNYYKVEMNVNDSYPMCLTDALKVSEDPKVMAEIGIEYWFPTKNWSFLEFLSPSMTILDIVTDIPAHYFYDNTDYMKDFELKRNFLKSIL